MIFTRLQNLNRGEFSQFRRVVTLPDDLNNLFLQALGQPVKAGFDTEACRFPALDLYEDNAGLVVKVELPGTRKEDINIALEDGVLAVSGERKANPKPETGSICRCERTLGQFERRVTLPYQVDAGKIQASYTDGVLTVTLPKAEEAKSKQIPINN